MNLIVEYFYINIDQKIYPIPQTLLHSNTLRQVSWLIHIMTQGQRRIVSKQLQGNYRQCSGQQRQSLRDYEYLVNGAEQVVFVLFVGDGHDMGATGFYFFDVADGLLQHGFLSRQSDDRNAFFNQCQGTML